MKLVWFIVGMVFILSSLVSAEPRKHLVDNDGVGVKGYDVVQYFKNRPTKGKPQYFSDYDGVRYLFSNAENKAAFDAKPDRYVPEYGGYCAYAIAEGKIATINPKTYTIINDRLYLFYNKRFVNTLKLWNRLVERDTETAVVQRAERHWSAYQSGELELKGL